MLLTIEADSCHVEAAIGTAVCTVIPFADGSEASASQSVMHSPDRGALGRTLARAHQPMKGRSRVTTRCG